MSRIRTNLITNRMANGAPTVSHGLVISGVTTVTGSINNLNLTGITTISTLDLNGDLDVDGHLNADNVSIAGVVTATTFSGSGASLTNLNGSNIASGTVPVARIGTGTKNTSTFYRGDGTFATVTAPAITAINGASNNRIVTSDGGTTVTAESGLTWSGAQLYVESTGDSQIRLQKPSSDSNDWNYIEFAGANGTRDFFFGTWSDGTPTWSRDDGNTKIQILNGSATINGHWRPEANNTYDLGTSTYRWRDIYTNDLNLSNEGGKNDVDGTWGNYTIQEGESDLFLINKSNTTTKQYCICKC